MTIIDRFILAFKAFIKAWKSPELAKQFISEAAIPSSSAQVEPCGEASHLRLLGLLQTSGRLVDFLKEDIAGFDDAQIGAAVRKIHEDCSQCLEDLVTIRPIMQENEGASISVPAGYNPAFIKVVGNIKGEPPFTGKLVHKGWKAHKRSLPKKIATDSVDVICPAEIEIK